MTHSHYILDNSPRFEWIRLRSTDSTNEFLKHYRPAVQKEMTLVTADFQTSGRGQTGSSWESETAKNLLFSLLFHPHGVEAARQFCLAQAVALAICETLSGYTGNVSIKWPNDIYRKDRKICGMLIENSLTGRHIEACIVGVGVNVNQQMFRSDAPNPVSLRQVTGKEHDPVAILADIVGRFMGYYQDIRRGDAESVARNYKKRLYRRKGFHPYKDAGGTFEAEIRDVEPTGHLVLADRGGVTRRYAFKEVRHVIPSGVAAAATLAL